MSALLLTGWKTYLAVGLMVVVALAEGALGIDVPGVNVADDWVKLLLEALGIGGLRAAIARNMLDGILKK